MSSRDPSEQCLWSEGEGRDDLQVMDEEGGEYDVPDVDDEPGTAVDDAFLRHNDYGERMELESDKNPEEWRAQLEEASASLISRSEHEHQSIDVLKLLQSLGRSKDFSAALRACSEALAFWADVETPPEDEPQKSIRMTRVIHGYPAGAEELGLLSRAATDGSRRSSLDDDDLPAVAPSHMDIGFAEAEEIGSSSVSGALEGSQDLRSSQSQSSLPSTPLHRGTDPSFEDDRDYSFKSAVCESGGVAAALKKRYQSKADLVEEMMTGLNAYVDLLLTGDDADVEDDFLQKHLVHPFHGEKRRKCEHTIGSPKNLGDVNSSSLTDVPRFTRESLRRLGHDLAAALCLPNRPEDQDSTFRFTLHILLHYNTKQIFLYKSSLLQDLQGLLYDEMLFSSLRSSIEEFYSTHISDLEDSRRQISRKIHDFSMARERKLLESRKERLRHYLTTYHEPERSVHTEVTFCSDDLEQSFAVDTNIMERESDFI